MLSRPDYRPDVDGLRAIAVLAVVGFHAFPEFLPGGFVGVDVFFVVSGFLISSLILGSLADGRFSFGQFYARRIKRLFPALLLVLAASLAVGWFALLPEEYRELGKHIAAGAGFLSNIVLWREAGYFDELAVLKPLLHLWSLGIEEQFYLAWPLLLWLGWKRPSLLLPLVLAAAGASFAVNLATAGSNAVGAFYSPLSRFFELLAGSALAVLVLQGRIGTRGRDACAVIGLVCIAAALLLIDKDSVFPGWWALLPVLGTCLVIAAGAEAGLNRAILARPALVWIGLISYPLYLWHWPLLSFGRIIEREELPVALRIALVLASGVLAWATYVLVEKPVRFGPNARAKVAVLCALMVAIGLGGYATYRAEGLPSRAIGDSAREIMAQAAWPYWTDPACSKRYGVEPCLANSERPRYMILGDSHANHLYPGLALADPAFEVVQAGSCPPLEGVRLRVLKNQDKHPCAALDALALNKQILQRHPEIRTVFVVALWRNALTGELINARERSFWGGVALSPAAGDAGGRGNAELALQGLAGTVEMLQARGLRVVLLRDTPDIGAELVEYCKFSPRFNPRQCTLPRQDFIAYRRPEEAMLRALREKFPALPVYDPIDALCDAERCYLMRDGVLLYRDNHHLSVNGSKLLADDLKKWMAKNRLLD
jgi:peptidoglycan/LPS O-acetylase OafA/YrhL